MESVEILIGGRRFRLQCGPGETGRVQELARIVDHSASELIQGRGGLGEEKMLLLASLTLADRLEEARRELDASRAQAERARSVLEERLALVVATAARRLDAIAAEVERAG
jgi:cell division protein ZapA